MYILNLYYRLQILLKNYRLHFYFNVRYKNFYDIFSRF